MNVCLEELNPYDVINEQFQKEQQNNLFGFLYENIFSAMNHCICELLISPGTVIQEKHLADTLQVSRTPLRQALSMLTESGLLIAQPKSGYVIPRLDVETFSSANSARIAYESSCAELAAKNANRKDLGKIKNCFIQMKNLDFSSLDYETIKAFIQTDLDFHSLICLASKNSYLIEAYQALEPRLRHMRYQSLFDNAPFPLKQISTFVYDEHLMIYMAIRNRNSELAFETTRIHLNNSLSLWGLAL